MSFKSFIPSILVFLLTVSTNVFGQNIPNSKNLPPKSKLITNSDDFTDGKTVVTEVVFTGLDSNYIDSDDGVIPLARLSDLMFKLRENRAMINADDRFDSLKIEKTIKLIKEFLADRGFWEAKIVALAEKRSKDQIKLIFAIEKGALGEISNIIFTGTRNFSNDELAETMTLCLGDKWRTYDWRRLQYCANGNVRSFMFSKGYLKAQIKGIGKRFKDGVFEITIEVQEGNVHRYGQISVEGASVFTETEILEIFGRKPGDVANGEEIKQFAYEKLPRLYKDRGYLAFGDEFEPEFIESASKNVDPIVNIKLTLDEGPKFRFASIDFNGVSENEHRSLIERFPLRKGDVYNTAKVEEWLKKLNETDEYKYIDADQDVEISLDETRANVYLVVKMSKKEP